jgi:hypothetical protein
MEENTAKNNTSTLLNSFLIITHALELMPNSNHYRELKNRMSPDEVAVLKHLQKQNNSKKHRINKQEGQVLPNNRGRRKKPEDLAIEVYDNAEPSTAINAELPPSDPA